MNIEFDKNNFYTNTKGIFTEVNKPRRKPDYISRSKKKKRIYKDRITGNLDVDIIDKNDDGEIIGIGYIDYDDYYNNNINILEYWEVLKEEYNYFLVQEKKGCLSSEYWYTKEGVIRGSDHWGQVASCQWNLPEWDEISEYWVYAFCKWSDFTIND